MVVLSGDSVLSSERHGAPIPRQQDRQNVLSTGTPRTKVVKGPNPVWFGFGFHPDVSVYAF